MNDMERWRDRPLAVVDVETTGLDPEQDRVIEIAIVHMLGGEIEGVWEQLVNPERDLPEEVTNITGIKPEQLVGAPTFPEIAEEVQARLEGRAFVAYNLAFDRAFVRGELERAGRAWTDTHCIDPLIFVRELQRGQGSKRLGAVAERMGVVLEDWHRAGADAEAAGRILFKLADQLPEGLDDLLMLQAQWEQQQQNEMANWKGRRPNAMGSVTGNLGAGRGNALGPAYVYGDDADPVRAMFSHLPASGTRR